MVVSMITNNMSSVFISSTSPGYFSAALAAAEEKSFDILGVQNIKQLRC